MGQRLCFPTEIIETNCNPHLVLWCTSLHTVYIIELAVPQEDAVNEAYQCERVMYTKLSANSECVWKSEVYPVEFACRICVGMLTTSFLRICSAAARPNFKTSMYSLVLLKGQARGSGIRGTTLDSKIISGTR